MLKTFAMLGALIVGPVATAAEPVVAFQVISDLGFRSSKSIYIAINSQPEWAVFWKTRNTYLLPETTKTKTNVVPLIDFEHFTLLVASSGTKSNAGFSLAFANVREFQGVIKASVLDIGPGTSCPTAQEITNPRVFALIPKSSKHVEFVVLHATIDCEKSEKIDELSVID
jgi:hypothetical protein